MFSATLIGLLVGLSAMAWVYGKVMRRTGNNTKSAVTTSAIAGVGVFVVIVTLVWTIDSMMGN